MKTLDLSLLCPACEESLKPRVLGCPSCDLKIEGAFQMNEFAQLGGEDLHLLRIFIRSEGRIRDMESALGLTYPTIRSRLASLRARLGLGAEISAASEEEPKGNEETREMTNAEVLEALQNKKITYEEALKRLKGKQK